MHEYKRFEERVNPKVDDFYRSSRLDPKWEYEKED